MGLNVTAAFDSVSFGRCVDGDDGGGGSAAGSADSDVPFCCSLHPMHLKSVNKFRIIFRSV